MTNQYAICTAFSRAFGLWSEGLDWIMRGFTLLAWRSGNWDCTAWHICTSLPQNRSIPKHDVCTITFYDDTQPASDVKVCTEIDSCSGVHGCGPRLPRAVTVYALLPHLRATMTPQTLMSRTPFLTIRNPARPHTQSDSVPRGSCVDRRPRLIAHKVNSGNPLSFSSTQVIMATAQHATDALGHAEEIKGLLTIPPEIFEAIAEQVEPEDLLRLRRVNKEVKEKVKRTFINTHFRRRMFLLCYEQSLKTLLAIAKHPDYGPAMRVITFSHEQIRGPDHTLTTEHGDERLERFEGTPSDTRILAELQDREWHRLYESQKAFFDGGGDIAMLTEIFSHLRSIGNNPVIAIMVQDSAETSAYGATTLEALTSRALNWGEDENHPVDSVLQAVTSADCPLTGLDIQFNNFGWEMYFLASSHIARQCAPSIFCTLKCLHMGTCWDVETDVHHAVDTSALFDSCPALECLLLETYDWRRQTWQTLSARFAQGLLDCNMPKLKAMRLRGFPIPFNSLVDFAKRHSQFAELWISKSSIYSMGSFDDGLNDKQGRHGECVHQLLANTTDLQAICIERSRVREWRDRGRRYEGGADDGEGGDSEDEMELSEGENSDEES